MAFIEYKGKKFEVDEDGFLLKFEDWNPDWVEYMAVPLRAKRPTGR